MALVRLEIDGRRVTAESDRTILEVARENGISIPTLCHDDRLEPFASCYLCVVRVGGARTLLPACATKVSAGMVVETTNEEIRRARRAALELLLSDHYADCIGPCQLSCPAGIDIQGYIGLTALGKYHEAVALIKEKNPLPAICGRVCTRPCEVTGCRRNLLDEPVGIDYIKRYVADLELAERDWPRPPAAAPNGRKMAVVGAGPAGLSCAYYLALGGYHVDILEALPEPGGMLRYGIPEYRLPKDVLDLEIGQILSLGVTLSTNTVLGRDYSIASLKEGGYDAIFLGIGAWGSSKLRVPDEDAPGVIAGIDFLRQVGLGQEAGLHGRVLVFGGGNTAIDCARSALRLGAEEVRLLYRRTRAEMPANEMEIAEAQHEGVAMDFLTAPVRVGRDPTGRVEAVECVRMELGAPDASGRPSPRPVPGSEFRVGCDFVLVAIGQSARVEELIDGRIPGFLPPDERLDLSRWKTIEADGRTGETSIEGVFSGGDVVTGAATVIEAIAAGRRAAYAMDRYAQVGHAEAEPEEFVSRKDAFHSVTVADLRSREASRRISMPVLLPEVRRRSFAEVERGFSPDDAWRESLRCMECGCSALFTCDLRRYATEYGAKVDTYLGQAREHQLDRTHPLIELDSNKCILCGRCVRICDDVVGIGAFGFVQRGFDSVVKPALGGSLLDTDCISCGLCIDTCPTGAIAERNTLVKSGPWRTTHVESVCSYCGAGCRIGYEVFGNTLVEASRSILATAADGNYCGKGRFGYATLRPGERLSRAAVREGGEQRDESVDGALRRAAERLRRPEGGRTGDEVAVFVSPRLSNEEIYLAQKLARVALGTHNVTSFAHLVNRQLWAPEVLSTSSLVDLSRAEAILVVNSRTDEEHFVAGLACNQAIRSGGRLVYIGPERNRTALFAEIHLRCREGGQPFAVAGILGEYARREPAALRPHPGLAAWIEETGIEQLAGLAGVSRAELAEAGRILAESSRKVVVFNKDYRGLRRAGDERLFAEAADALGGSLLALREKANMQGLADMGAGPSWLPGSAGAGGGAVEALERHWGVTLSHLPPGSPDVAGLLRDHRIKTVVILGEDPFGAPGYPPDLIEGLRAAELLVVGDLFATATTAAADIVLPLSSTAESSGTMTNQEGRVLAFDRAVAPVAGLETWEILCGLAAHLGHGAAMAYGGTGEVTAEIARVVPWYAGAHSGGDPAPESPGRAAPARIGFDPAFAAGEVVPVETLALDASEARLARWLGESFRQARAALRRA